MLPELLLDKDGRISSPPACLYRLVTGELLYSEEATREGDEWVFPLDKTALVQIVSEPNPDGKGATIRMMGGKIAGSPMTSPFMSRTWRYHVINVVRIEDVSDPKVLRGLRGLVSSLTILPGG